MEKERTNKVDKNKNVKKISKWEWKTDTSWKRSSGNCNDKEKDRAKEDSSVEENSIIKRAYHFQTVIFKIK